MNTQHKPENQIIYYVTAIESLQWILSLTDNEAHLVLEPLTDKKHNKSDYEKGYNSCEDILKENLTNQIKFKMLQMKNVINEIANSFATEYTKFSHRFPYVDSNNYQTKELSEKAKKTYKLLYQNKVNQLVESLPDFIDKTFFATIYE